MADDGPVTGAPPFLVASGSDTGLSRSRQEDAVLGVAWTRPDDGDAALVLAVADGMGGAQGGDAASRGAMSAVRQALEARWRARRLGSQAEWFAAYGDLFHAAVDQLSAQARENDDLQHMGTTLTCLAVQGGRILFGHVGDSRAYLYRAGVLQPLTTDHNAATELASEGQIAPDAVATHKSRHVLTRWLAPDTRDADPEVGGLAAEPGDAVLVCSDGLHGMVSDDEIAATLSAAPLADQPALDRAVAALIARANERGGKDNISVALGYVRRP
jgi:protein phosphatase